MVSGCFRYLSEYGVVTETPQGKQWATWAIGEREGSPQGVAPPPMGSPNWTRVGGAAPLSLSFPLSPSDRRKGRQIGLGVQVGFLPTWRALGRLPPLSLH